MERRKFTSEFKLEAVRLIKERDVSYAQLERDRSVHQSQLHTWVKLLSDGTHISVESLAQSVGVHPKIFRNGIRMAFLAPTITKAILEGDHTRNLGLKDFIGAVPLSWSEQRLAFRSE